MLNVIILHWEDSASLDRCLGHLIASDYPYLRVIVVENGSSSPERAEAAAIVARYLPWFKCLELLQLDQNLGYSGGNNAALTYLNRATFDGDVCILNPDVSVQERTLSAMMAALSSGVGLVMCRATDDAGKVLYDGIKLSGFHQDLFVSNQEIVPTDYAQGACFIVRRELVTSTLFDNRFFLYWEEVDLALRVRAAGCRIVSVTTVSIERQRNSTERLPNALYYSARNGLLMRHRYPNRFSQAGYILYLARLHAVSLKLITKPRAFSTALSNLWNAVRDARAGRYGRRTSLPAQRSITPKLEAPSLRFHVEEGMIHETKR